MGSELDDIGGTGGNFDVDLLAAQIRADSSDTDTFFAVLAIKLSDALGGRVRLQKSGRGLRRKAPVVTGIEVDLTEAGDGLVLRAERQNTGVQCSIARPVRGVVLSNRPVPIAEWIETLTVALADQARRSEQARDALGGMLT